MVDISSQNNKINVTVSSSGNTANTNVTPDYAQYYSEKSKEWAISNRIVDNTDYSSKYYANESKKQAVLATEQATIATNKTSEVVASGNEALTNIDTAKNNAITSITNQETTSKTSLIDEGATQIGLIQNEGATQIANVQSTGFYMRDDKLYYINSQGEETEFKLDDIELNNPYSLFDSKYSDHELNNLSWLKSEGQWNTKAVYPDAYDKLLKVYNGTETVEGLSVKLSTETYTDYDFVLNTTDETFRLPLLDGSEDLPSDTVVSRADNTVINAGETKTLFTASHNGNISIKVFSTTGGNTFKVFRNNVFVGGVGFPANAYNQSTISFDVKRGDVVVVNLDQGTATYNYLYSKAVGNGSLYFYVGETVQNANLIDAGRIGEQLATKTDMLQASGAGMPSNKYIDLELGASGTTYTAPANGYFLLDTLNSSGYSNITIENITNGFIASSGGNANFSTRVSLPTIRGNVIEVRYNTITKINKFRFYYAVGSEPST